MVRQEAVKLGSRGGLAVNDDPVETVQAVPDAGQVIGDVQAPARVAARPPDDTRDTIQPDRGARDELADPLIVEGEFLVQFAR